MSEDRVLDRIGKLLAQAEGTDNEHEAEAFVERAQELATTYAVDLERARARQSARRLRAAEAALEQRRLAVGQRARRGNRHLVLLYVAVAQPNDVLVNVASDSTYVIGFGYPDDLDVVERLWASLATQMAAAAARRLRAGEHRAEGAAAVSWRLSFYDGYLRTVSERLTAARERALDSGTQDEPHAPSAQLVLRAKSERVRVFHDGASSARGTWRGARSEHQRSGRAYQAGQRDGRSARLGEPGLEARRAVRG